MSLRIKIAVSLALAAAIFAGMNLDSTTLKHTLSMMASAVWGS